MVKSRLKEKLMSKYRPNHYRNLSIPAGIITSLLLTFVPNTTVLAEENTTNIEKETFQLLYDEFHTLIETLEQTKEETTENQSVDSPQLVSENEDLQLIKDNLLAAVEKISSADFADRLSAASLTIEELDLIFDEAVTKIIEAEEIHIEGEIEAIDVPEVEEKQEIVEELEVVEEAPELPAESLVEEETPMQEIEAEEVQVESLVTEVSEAKSGVLDIATAQSEPVTLTMADDNTFYTVKAGDTLDSIARKYKTTSKVLAAENGLSNPNLIFVGQRLKVSGNVSVEENELEDLNKPLSSSEFIEIVGEQAQVVASDNNLYASVMIAQSALESGYGKSTLSSAPNHNLFGIKGSYNGESVTMQTQEYSDATGWVTIYDNFKKYPSYTESLLDNARLLRNGLTWNPAFYSGTWMENTTSYRDATSWLQGRYATDPTYATKLNNIIANYNLTRFDLTNQGEIVVTPIPAPEAKPEPRPVEKPVTPSTSTSAYTVKAGDTLSHISRSYNMSVSELKRLNNLTSDLIVVGQSLKVKVEIAKPAPAPTPAPKPQAPTVTTGSYKVKAGDTLSHIALANKMSVSELKTLNNLTSDLIFVGQSLKVKAEKTTPAPKPAPKPVQKPAAPNVTNSAHTVKAGDTLSHIALANKMSVSELKRINNLKSDLIFVGQKLTISGVEKETPSPAPKPAKPTIKPVTPSASTGTYTVKTGDTLSHISRNYHMSVSGLKQLNNLTSDLIFVGQRLKVKEDKASVPSKPAPSKLVTPSSNTGTYTVKAGDTLSHIGRNYNLSVAKLKELNNLRSDLIFVGQRLVVSNQSAKPVSTKSSSKTSANTTHRIASGDTLSGIALKYGTTVRSLKEKNQLRSDLILVGQILTI